MDEAADRGYRRRNIRRVQMRFLIAAVAATAVLAGAGCSRAQTPPLQNAVTFMAQNALAEGVKTLPSGIQYKVIKSGPADGAHPTPEDLVKVNYEGSLTNGKVFDSSIAKGKPVTFQLKGLIPGWIDAMQYMRPGDEWVLYIPPNLGYGDEGAGPIPPNAVLVFKLELIAVGAAAGPASQ
jgi:peptidylprolyl isomerase/FKBP-type peptidyl-prolyl cis-trans isomerase FklB